VLSGSGGSRDTAVTRRSARQHDLRHDARAKTPPRADALSLSRRLVGVRRYDGLRLSRPQRLDPLCC